MKRRHFLILPALTAARGLLAAEGKPSPLGLAAFSSHQHWRAAREGRLGVKFRDAAAFYEHARALGGDGVQASLRGHDRAFARALRARVEQTGGYFEGDVGLPQAGGDVAAFEREVELVREAGASVARTYFTAARRYETFRTPAEFREFHRQAQQRLAAVLPVLQKHQLRLAVENHKDLMAAELAALLGKFDSPWLGVTVDTGNNIALLEEPQTVIEVLAPWAFTVHLKDMAVQPAADGFLLSEIPFGQGFLDLPRMVATLRRANPQIAFNVEMATRDPLPVPCREDAYWASFDRRDQAAVDAALERVRQHPPQFPPPRVSGKDLSDILAQEETNNRLCLAARADLRLCSS